jgi:hypothetical protein
LLAPDFGVVLHVGEIGADLDRVSVLHHPAGEVPMYIGSNPELS